MKTKKEKKVLVAVAAVLTMLAGTGVVAAGFLTPEIGGGDLLAMIRQAAWCGVGVGAAILAACVPWHVWMTVAPGMAGLWAGIFCACYALPFIDGECRWLPIGSFMLDMYLLAWPVLAVALAWLRTALPCSTRTLLIIVCLALGSFAGVRIMTNPNLRARLAAFCGQSSVVENLGYDMYAFDLIHVNLEAAVDESEWFGESRVVTVKDIPCPHTSGVLFSSLVRFGRLFPIGVLTLFSVLAAGLLTLWHWSDDAARRLYVLAYGLPLVALPFLSVGEGLGIVPLFGEGVPLVSFGGTALIAAGIGFGVLWSSVAKDEGSKVCQKTTDMLLAEEVTETEGTL